MVTTFDICIIPADGWKMSVWVTIAKLTTIVGGLKKKTTIVGSSIELG